ncbi:MAG TPA: hypothetical protein DCR10_02110 [Acidimicrobiaceae bacterium]|nr:hypothetical protein [Acidimicrobiaceae bacterium]
MSSVVTVQRQPGVLFLCVHNAGRSQMAAGWMRHLAGDLIRVFSAGSAPAETLNPAAVEAMAEVGIDISEAEPMVWTDQMASDVEVVVSMGCGDRCSTYPGTRLVDWDVADPAGQGLEMVRAVRDEIEIRVRGLVDDLVSDSDGVTEKRK